MRQVEIIYNPDSGRRLLKKNMPRLKTLLEQNGQFQVILSETTGPGHAKELAARGAQTGGGVLVAAGGDGTVNEVVNGMMEAGKTGCELPNLAIYPAGTVNDLGSYFGIPKQLETFAALLEAGKTCPLDVGLAGDRYFVNVAAAGLLTNVAHRVSSDYKTFFGRFAYYFEGIKELPRQFYDSIEIEFKSGTTVEKQEILFFILANSPQVGGFKNLASEAKTDDGLFDLILFQHSSPIEMAGLPLLMLQGTHINHPTLRYLQLKEFTIHTKQQVAVDVDGEFGGMLPMRFKVISKALNLVVPETK